MTTTNNNSRPTIAENQAIVLVSQVDRHCPLCSRPLIDLVRGRRYKRYEVAHIYPLNPTPAEADLLRDEERLSDEPNDLDNLIPLCESCHGAFDKPRTVDGYRKLCTIKRALIARDKERHLWHCYTLDQEVANIVHSLAEQTDLPELPADFDVTTASSKTEDVPAVTRRKILSDVRYYYVHVRQTFRRLEESDPSTARLIASQVQSYYLAQTKLSDNKRDLYFRVARWIQRRTNGAEEASEIVASFFVQNCEVLR